MAETLDFRNGFGYMCHLDLSQKPKMSDVNGALDAVVRLTPEILDLSEITRPLHVSQGTQVGVPTRRPRPLLHHSSEYTLSRPLPQRLGSQKPFYTGRSGQPYPDPLPYTGYLTTATRARRGRPYLNYSADSPTSSLDCLTTKDFNADTMYQGKVNSAASGEDRRQGTPPGGSSRSCRCTCHCSGEPEPPGPQSAEGLSWRRLHMSRAKLKATATTSELLSGFAMIAMVELQINEPTNVPEWLFVMFAVCTTVLVAVHIFALMISTYLLPTIDAVSKMSAGDVLRESPHERMRGFIELAWAFSTVLGLFLFLVEIAILCWVKFWDYSFVAATAATVIVIPVLIVFVAFAVHFYHSLVVHKCEASTEDMEQLENMKRNLDSATTNTAVNSPV